MAFGLATTDDDGASFDEDKKITPKMESALRDLIIQKGLSNEQVLAVLEMWECKTLKDIKIKDVVNVRNELAKEG